MIFFAVAFLCETKTLINGKVMLIAHIAVHCLLTTYIATHVTYCLVSPLLLFVGKCLLVYLVLFYFNMNDTT